MSVDLQPVNKNFDTSIDRQCFYSGTPEHPIYVDFFASLSSAAKKLPIVMLHGGFHTGAGYISTPDGRLGWAHYFAKRGHDVYVPDWPGHGRSPANKEFATLSTHDVATSLNVLMQEVGRAIIFAHSAAGPVAWWLAGNSPLLVAAVVGIAPGPPANIQQALPDDPIAIAEMQYDHSAGCPIYSAQDKPVWVSKDFIKQFWANSPKFPKDAFEIYAKSIVPESAAVLNERFHIGGKGLQIANPEVVSDRPILIVTGELDLRHPRATDAQVADFFKAEHLWLPQVGVVGNGHMLMLETNSDDIACLIGDWLARNSL
jgi:pimeloyl-ACP methyl ester carboxylesterase